MTRILRVGDPHILISNLSDSNKLIESVFNYSIKNNITHIEFLGDLFHNHAVMRLEILNFWKNAFKKLSEIPDVRIIAIAGNHDMVGGKADGMVPTALDTLQTDKVKIVNKPYGLKINDISILYMPYYNDHIKYLKDCEDMYRLGYTDLLVAHQTFTGAQYASGFYADDGIDPASLPQTNIISGHIHTTQQIGKCFYPGTPKWDGINDANQEKGFWVFEHKKDTYNKKLINTQEIVTKYVKYTVKEGEEIPDLDPKNKNYLELVGSSSWVVSIKKKIKDSSIAVKSTITDARKVKDLQRDTSGKIDIFKYLESNFKPLEGVSFEDIEKYVKRL
jgi:DNA repair exonuclease SbcCD nuclease subunit